MSATDPKSPSDPPPQSESGALQRSGARAIDIASDVAGVDGAAGTPSSPSADTPTLKELMANLTVGTVIDGKYAIDAVIGRGGMGVVVSARHVDLGKDVALKFLCSADGAVGVGADLRARFRREAQISAKLDNEHITRVLDVGAWKNASYIVMERLEGSDLRKKLKASTGGLPLEMALNYTLQICEGIAEAHAHGIVHRDLKPANLFITRKSDGSDLIKIMDFGISKWNGGEIGEITKDGTLLGSPKYMAPEQIFGAKHIDTRADIWSIGAILFEMLTGRTPYVETTLARLCAALVEGPPPRVDELRPEMPARLADVVVRSLDSTPANRIPSVAELAGAILDAVDAPGEALRQRLAVILSLKPPIDQPSASQLMSNLGLGPPSVQTTPSHALAQMAAQLAQLPAPPGVRGATASGTGARVEIEVTPQPASGPVQAKTLVSPASARSPAQEIAPAAAPGSSRSRILVIAAVVGVVAAVAAFMAARATSSAPGPTARPEVTAAPPPPTPAPAPVPTTATTPSVVVTPAPATTAAAEAAASPTSASPLPPRGKVGPGALHTPPGHATAPPTGPVTPKKGDDEIPSTR